MLKKLSAIISIFVVIMYFALSNQKALFAYKAYNCFKNNNIKCAQKNYEKAFELGYVNEKARNIYVNSIINSPFDIEAQNKIINFLSYEVEDSAKNKLDFFLHDLKQEIHKNYPQNYIKQTTYNQKILRWGSLPITYNIIADSEIPNYIKNEIEKAFFEWERATEGLILFKNDIKNSNIVFKLEKENPAQNNNKKYIAAFTTPEINGQKLEKMEIKIYITNPLGEMLTENQIFNTALHEIGHALGFMGHSTDKNNIMYMTKDTIASSEDSRDSLTEGDINTIKLLYKIKPDITNSNDIVAEYRSEFVLGSTEEINRAKITEAKNYIKNAPSIVTGYIDLAETFSANKEYSKAIKTLEQAARITDSDELSEIVYYNLALMYYHIDHMDLAKDYIYKSIEIKQTEEKSFLLAEILNKNGEFSEAEKEYKYLIRKKPDNIEYTIALTNLYITNKKYLKARKTLAYFIKRNPSEKNNPRFKPYGILQLFL